MKIAHISPHWSPYQPDRLMGVKRIIANLSNEQLKRGHEVTIIAPKDSTVLSKDRLITTTESLRNYNIYASDPRSLYYGIVHASIAAKNAHKFDVIHSHIEQVFLPFISMINTPVVSTIHGTEFNNQEIFLFNSYKHQFYSVAISKRSQEINKEIINFNNQVYNGIDIDDWVFNDVQYEDYMLYLGRINPKKGVIDAVDIANSTQKKLKIVGFKEISFEQYYEQILSEARISEFASYEGELFEPVQKYKIFSKARLFLFPVQYEETFASTPLESMAAGTPVVAFARGSLTEQIIDGKTGFLVNSSEEEKRGEFIIKKTGIDGLREAVERIFNLDNERYIEMRKESRKQVEDNFTTQKMVDRYEEIYKKLLTRENE